MKEHDTRRSAYSTFLALVLLPALCHAAEDFSQKQARSGPSWLGDGVIYEIFPRHFSRQGDFNGITEQLDRLKEQGIDILWLMPIHPIGEKLRKGSIGSPYAVRDYYGIHPDYGTTNDLKRLTSEAHARGMKVILDLVANHTAWDNVLVEQHPEFYKQNSTG